MATHYPPCRTGACGTDPSCCVQPGYKWSWPELVGKPAAVAKATIERDDPLATVVVLGPGRVGFLVFCCNRVYVYLDQKGNVFRVPVVG